MNVTRLFPYVIFFLFFSAAQAQQDSATIIDSRHYSNVLGEIRNFRIFLPPGYSATNSKKYPVIYFFHGWGQRYFGEGAEEYAGYDKGTQNKGDNIANYVAKHNVIVVKADGYNRRGDEEYYRRPYNVLPVETYRQFPIYFPELVTYIDDHYHTMADRQHRAVSGLSMGGFMSFVLAAKYPDMVSSAGSFCGAPEFTIGPYDFPVEYKHMDMYKNLAGINVRLHYGDKDFIRSYHNDMNRMWYQVMDNYKSKIYDAAHSTCGLGEMFDTIMSTFKHPLPIPARWDHTEVYPEFEVWNYNVSTDRTVPGFTVLENVDKRGFRSAVREYVPDGRLLQNVQVSVLTAPVYDKSQEYIINDIDLFTMKASQRTVRSDTKGRIAITVNGSVHEIGINKKNDKPDLSFVNFNFTDAPWAVHRKEIKLHITLVNKGNTTARNVKATITSFRNNVKISSNKATIGIININEIQNTTTPFSFTSTVDSADIIKFRLDITDDAKNKWTEYFDLPIKRDAQPFAHVEIADGRTVAVVSSGIELDTLLLGKGNGDGIANPGESIVLLVKDSGRLFRTDLTFSHQNLNPRGLIKRHSDWFTNMDHVGGSAKYDEVLIAADCADGTEIPVFGEYWTANYPMHIANEGTATISVSGTDKTAPIIDSVQYRGDNTIEAFIYDGGVIKNANAQLTLQEEKKIVTSVVLHDDGKDGDRTAGDNIFSAKIADAKFSVYKVSIEAEDALRNKVAQDQKTLFIAH